MQDIGDEKLQIMQTIQDLIEKKARQLDIDYKNLSMYFFCYKFYRFCLRNDSNFLNFFFVFFQIIEPKLEQENNEPLNVSNANSISSTSKNGTTSNSNGNSSINNTNNNGNTERQSRRGRRTTRTDATAEAVQSTSDSNVLSENQSSNLPGTSNGKRSSSATNTSSRKNKKRNTSQANQSREESPPKNDDSDENTDEPLYCTCNRVSFGKMIMCDNDSCSLEWFHFSCVNLTTKPKGKWYCPQCRGSRPNIMKSKTQLR